MTTLYIKLQNNTPNWKKWLIDKSNWYKYNIAWKQRIWVIYDSLEKRVMYPGGLTINEASNNKNRLENLRRDLVL